MTREGEDVLVTEKFRVELRRVVRNGKELERHIVVHPGAAVILPLLEDGRVVMVENDRVSVGRKLLELPAGTLEPKEEPIACAARELEEETGYAAGRLSPLVQFLATPGICTERMYAFLAEDLQQTAQNLDEGEVIVPVLVEYDEALRMIRDGRIEDGKTIAALLYFDRFVRR